MNLHDWIDELSDVLDLEDVEVDEGLLADLTKLTSENVERLAGPVTTFLLGWAAAVQGADPGEVEELAAKAQELAEGWDRPHDGADPDDIDDPIPDDRTVDHTGEHYDDDRADELVEEDA